MQWFTLHNFVKINSRLASKQFLSKKTVVEDPSVKLLLTTFGPYRFVCSTPDKVNIIIYDLPNNVTAD